MPRTQPGDTEPSVTNSTFDVLEAVRTTTTVDALKNGVSNGSTSTSGTADAGAYRYTLGLSAEDGSEYLNGHLAAVLLYGRVLDATERSQVCTYLAAPFSITL